MRSHFGGCWLHDRHLYGVSFTDSIDEHTAALQVLVGLPERLRTRQCSHSLAALRETAKAIVHAEMRQGPDGTLVATGVIGVAKSVKDNVVEVYVRPGHPEVEARLRATYGAVIPSCRAPSRRLSRPHHLRRSRTLRGNGHDPAPVVPVAKKGHGCHNRPVPVEGHLLGERTWFFDTRGSVRRMGVSAHAGDSTMVFSLWQGDVCTGTFRLPASEAAGLISVLAYGMTETLSNQPPPSPDQPEPLRKVLAAVRSSAPGPAPGANGHPPSFAQVSVALRASACVRPRR